MDEVLYDEATWRRIDRQPRRREPRRAPMGARAVGSATFLTAIALGLQQVFDPGEGEEIVLELDVAGADGRDQFVSFDHDPLSVRRSRAYVRPWLAPT